ncbi:MAG: DUF2169 domain-containing protein [Gammaproteobacteria bacterium]|nr:DUF2169 domain-containing protein [Gammaproteobacteria bacterium]
MSYQEIDNKTPFVTGLVLLTDENGRDQLVALIKASYNVTTDGQLEPAQQHPPLCLDGEYYGEPGVSSLKIAPEANYTKQATDIAVIGQAHAPNGQTATQLDVSLSVGTINKTLRVFGDRHWQKSVHDGKLVWTMSQTQPFSTMPLIYEHAFGGMDTSPEDQNHHEVETANPLGLGFIAQKSDQIEGVRLPNIEDPQKLISTPADRPIPTGFGFISPEWEPRKTYAGSYDQHWEQNRMPLVPQDFNPRFYNAAHPSLLAPQYLAGNEAVEIKNATPDGYLAFNLPDQTPIVVLEMADEQPQMLDVYLDTLVINTDERTVQLLWRASHDVYHRIDDIGKLRVLPYNHPGINERMKGKSRNVPSNVF